MGKENFKRIVKIIENSCKNIGKNINSLEKTYSWTKNLVLNKK